MYSRVSSSSAGISVSGTNRPPYSPYRPRSSGRLVVTSMRSTPWLASQLVVSGAHGGDECAHLRGVLLSRRRFDAARYVDGVGMRQPDRLTDVLRGQAA